MTPTLLVDWLRANLAWAPPWTISIAVAATALVLVQLVYDLVVKAVGRTLHGRKNTFWRSLLMRSRGPGRLALILAALSWSVHAAPFPPRQSGFLQHALGIAFIVLVGWVVLAAVNIGAALYMCRYRMDVPNNLLARKHLTQIRILRRALATLVVVFTAAMALMTIPAVRQLGVSLLAAGGAAGIIVGLALQPVLSNLIAGVQIALTQPIRIDDAVSINGEFGHVEEINATYVVVQLWDQRRLVLPLKYFLDQPFQNWSRESAELVGAVEFLIDYRVPTGPLRAKFEEIVRGAKLWDGRIVKLEVTDAREHTLQIRGLVSAANADLLWSLRCEVRERFVDYLREAFPEALPRNGVEFTPAEQQQVRSAPRSDGGGQRVQ